MSLFNNSSRQLRRITEQCWKCPRTVPLSSTCHSFHQKKAKTYHGQNEKYTTKKQNTQVIVFISNELQDIHSLSHKSTFHFWQKAYISVNTKGKNTQKQQCVHLGVRDTPHSQIYFSRKNFNFHVDTKT